ncbi:MAG: hypothetical protein FJY29_02685 [Betaproteobacteria bacterium]|nr:hypothetical protein [Betaproteobacteria bacterium]
MLTTVADKKRSGLVLLLAIAAELLPMCAPLAHAEIFKALSTDSADHSCQVVLREARVVRQKDSRLPETETDATGQPWYVFEASVDTAAAPLKTGAQVYLLYRSQRDTNWHVAPGEAVPGASATLQRHSFRISADTLKADSPDTISFPRHNEALQLIPFLQSSDGRRIFDHNDHGEDVDTYALNTQNAWTAKTKNTTCQTAGRGSATLRFLGDWSTDVRGDLHPGQAMVVEYDLSRLPQCHGSSYNGLPAWQTEAYVRFFPSGEEFSAVLSTPQGGSMGPQPARFDIPENATRAQLWFKSRGRSCEGGYDSRFGKNYEFSITPAVTSSPAWAGSFQWLNSPTQSCDALSPARSLADVETLSSDELENQCIAIDSEVLVPGLTTSFSAQPQSIQAQVQWKTNTGLSTTQWLTFVGRNGQNFRYRWILPAASLRARAWSALDFTFRFSTDGLFWLQAGRESDNKMGVVEPRRIELNP